MRTLLDRVADEDERTLLSEHGMFCDLDAFVAALEPPESEAQNELVGLPAGGLLVHVSSTSAPIFPGDPHQVEVVTALREGAGVGPVILWHITDRAGSERFGMRIVLKYGSCVIGLSPAHRSVGVRELRFIDVDQQAVEEAVEQMSLRANGRNSDQLKAQRVAAHDRLLQLVAAARTAGPRTLHEFNAQFAGFLLSQARRLAMPAAFQSTMLEFGMFRSSVEEYLNGLDDVVVVFNGAVIELLACETDPHVKPLAEDYVPWHYSCPVTGRRIRLTHVGDGNQHLAAGSCTCGAAPCFALGTSTLSIIELAATGRLSLDASLPIRHRHHASGRVVGRSSAIHGIVFNVVASQVLGHLPIPGLTPKGPQDPDAEAPAQSLLAEYLIR